jgi:anti-sigma-K factor RskA
MMTDIHTLAGPYALDAVNDVERAAFARHIAECETCAMEVAELREVTARLADGTWSVPPPQLRDRVLAQVRRTRQMPPGRGGHSSPAAPRRWPRLMAVAAAAVLLAAGTGVGAYGVQEQRLRNERAATAAAKAREQQIKDVLAAPDVRLRSNTPLKGGPGRVTVVVSERLNAGYAVLDGLADPGPGKAYQLWMIEGDEKKSAGLLLPRATTATELINGKVRGADTFGVTIEPAGGSLQPNLNALVTTLTLD